MKNAFNPLADRIWELNRPEKIGLVQFNHRMVVARLSSGGLWVHSPVHLDTEIQTSLDDLGNVEHLVAPSLFHDLHWPEYFAAYPEACFHCAPGLKEEHPELSFNELLTDAPPDAWAGEIDQLIVSGMPKVNEFVFLHRPSRTLVVADLLFNLGRDLNLVSGILFWLFGTYGRIAVSRLFKSFIKDRVAMRQSIDQLLSWELDRIAVGHGEIIVDDARRSLERAYTFLTPEG